MLRNNVRNRNDTARRPGQRFDELNRAFFRGRLPRYRVRRCSQRTMRALLHASGCDCQGHCDDERRLISIVKGLSPSDERRVLLHEMCHIGTPGAHGKPWQRKMARLAQFGEGWAEEQRAEYSKRPTSFAKWVKGEIADLAMDPDANQLPWLKARKQIARRLCISVTELLRKAQWARLYWEEERAFFGCIGSANAEALDEADLARLRR